MAEVRELKQRRIKEIKNGAANKTMLLERGSGNTLMGKHVKRVYTLLI